MDTPKFSVLDSGFGLKLNFKSLFELLANNDFFTFLFELIMYLT